ncbi:3-deoxy-manno-octulosonate cytidylyltransferase [compost metagenome]
MRTLAIIQARMGSTRFPGKVLKPILGIPMLSLLIDRVRQSKRVDQIVVATSIEPLDDVIETLVETLPEVALYRGSEANVLSRYYEAAKTFGAEAILRVTADNPLFDPVTADRLIEALDGYDFVTNNIVRTFPYGIDLEAFTFRALEEAYRCASVPHQLEHVTPYIREHPETFTIHNIQFDRDLSQFRLTVDTPEDYAHVVSLFERHGLNLTFQVAAHG